ncbi:L,D-transpeptidase [Bacillus sp. FJAT-27445]|uniref:L,D-transpeptidase n=1 Tax=Bacillus sp. FJAT-27445 TaxID=1679166 RepID=UPI00074395B4|nr:L,D-transpeptidase [Bacillus sp. FJAT-27445]
MANLLAVLLSVLFVSPIWPLGPNPLPGDTFIIINKKTNEMAFIDDNRVQTVLSVGTGKSPGLTPEGLFTVTVKAENPYYRKKDIPGNDPANPLGTRWIGFDADGTDGRTYGLHGTNNPSSIGKYVSEGCVRLQNEGIESLYPFIPLGTKILITTSNRPFTELGSEYGAIQ